LSVYSFTVARGLMDRQQIGLKLALDALALPLELSDFDRRLILQKTIYLVQSARVDLGYTFRWYLRGPYSPGLTRDAFALKAESQESEDLQGWSLDAPSLERLGQLRKMIESIPSEKQSSRLELLASVHFLIQTRQANDSNVAHLREVLHKNDKPFSEDEIRQAIEELKKHELFPSVQSR
jgi:uncharacterized protein YwgA